LSTGYPPFSDKEQTEIYRKVKELDYNWPTESRRNDYPREIKDLVASLLVLEAEDRPEPDQIVDHPFFSMHGGDAIPSVIEIDNFSRLPKWLIDGLPRGDLMATDAPRISLARLGIQCGVGCFSGQSIPSVGEQVGVSIYPELLQEETNGRAPTVPLPEDFVYLSNNAPSIVKDVKPRRAATRTKGSVRGGTNSTKPGVITVSSVLDAPTTRSTTRPPIRPTRRANVNTDELVAAPEKPEIANPIRTLKPSITLVPTVPDGLQRTLPVRSVSNRSIRTVSQESQPKTDTPATSLPSEISTDTKPTTSHRTLIGPNEPSHIIPCTKPTEVVAMLSKLCNDITKCLQDATKQTPLIPPSKSHRDIHSRPHVVKWVDYTNKFGIGYILANGTIGCVFNGTSSRPSTCIIVPGAEDHLRKRDSPAYKEQHQIVPSTGPPVAFLENHGEKGIERIFVPPQNFTITVGKNGVPEKLSPVPNTFDNEKRRMLSLWDKFARYMTQTLGDCPLPGSDDQHSSAGDLTDSEHYVKFYQRLGNVGIWVFGSTTLQFNFPDHTKLVITPEGMCDFYHLSLPATQLIRKGRLLPKASLEERSVLSYPLTTLLRGKEGGKDFREIVEANELRKKVFFVRDVFRIWASNGGLGELGTKGREFRWVWVTVGKGGGDERREGVAPAKVV
jgi:hypothetical protein